MIHVHEPLPMGYSFILYIPLVFAIVLGAVCAERALNALEEKEREREEE